MDCARLSVLFALAAVSLAFPSTHNFKRLPKMVVFDTDFTLWPFWVDHSVIGPYHQNSTGHIMDSTGYVITYFPEVPKVFQYLKDHKIPMGILGPSFNVESTKEIINLFKWKDRFLSTQIYHIGEYPPFDKLKAESKIATEDMLFFEDEDFAIEEMKKLKLAIVEVENELTMQVLMDGLKMFSDMKNSQIKN